MKKRPSPLRAIDLFAGCGGLSRGLQEAGIPVLAGIDHWVPARTIYARNLGHDALDIDLADVEGAIAVLSKYEPTIVAGGPPCQEFSAAGTRQEGARADLTRAYVEIVARLQPRWVIMENVPQVRDSASYRAGRAVLKEAGYGLTERVLDASRCGVPQARKRFFAIGHLRGPDGELDAAIDAALTPAPLTLRAYLGAEAAAWPNAYYHHPRTYERRAIYTLDEPSATIRGVNRPRPKTYRQAGLSQAGCRQGRHGTSPQLRSARPDPDLPAWMGLVPRFPVQDRRRAGHRQCRARRSWRFRRWTYPPP